MILQFDDLGVNALLGIGIMFGFALLMTIVMGRSMGAFLIWLTIMASIVVWSGLLPLWVLIVCIIVLTGYLYYEIKNKGSVVVV